MKPTTSGISGESRLAELLPLYTVRSQHQMVVKATQEEIWEAVLAADFSSSWLTRGLMALRGYGWQRKKSTGTTLSERLAEGGFTELARIPGKEIVLGIAGKFWHPSGCLRSIQSTAEFAAFDEAGYAKAAWHLRVMSRRGEQILRTETRVLCYGTRAERLFRAYWLLVGPFSGVIRTAMLRIVKRDAERKIAPQSIGGVRARGA